MTCPCQRLPRSLTDRPLIRTPRVDRMLEWISRGESDLGTPVFWDLHPGTGFLDQTRLKSS